MEIASSPKSATHLPVDVIVEILSWAPANSVSRCRWACKDLFNLLSDPKFVKLHHLRRHSTTHEDHHQIINKTSFLVCTRSPVVYSIKCRDDLNQSSSPKALKMDSYRRFPKSNSYKHFKVLGSCNGLIYFLKFSSTFDSDQHCSADKLSYFLWNPCTGESKELPHPSIHPYLDHELISYHGFGYDHTIDDYKVVRITYYRCKYNFQLISKAIHVYTLGSNSWSTIRNSSVVSIDKLLNESGLYVNGALHWIKKSSFLVTVTSFHIAKEENQEIQLPNFVSQTVRDVEFDLEHHQFKVDPEHVQVIYLSVLNECLCIVHMDDFEKGLVDVWMMKVYGVKESWTKLFTIDMQRLKMDFLELHRDPIMYHNKDGEILVLCCGIHVFAYDEKKKKARYDHMIEDCRYYDRTITDYRDRGGFVVGSYIESLVSLNSGKFLTAAIPEEREKRKMSIDIENTKTKKQKSCSSST